MLEQSLVLIQRITLNQHVLGNLPSAGAILQIGPYRFNIPLDQP